MHVYVRKYGIIGQYFQTLGLKLDFGMHIYEMHIGV